MSTKVRLHNGGALENSVCQCANQQVYQLICCCIHTIENTGILGIFSEVAMMLECDERSKLNPLFAL